MLVLASLSIAVVRCATPILPIAIGRPRSSPPRSLPKQAFNAPRQQTASVEIPIAPDARSPHTFRGFLHWRFAYAGPTVAAAPPSWGRHPQPSQNATLNSSKFADRPTDTASLLLALCTLGTAASQAPQYCRLGQRIAGDELRIFGSSYCAACLIALTWHPATAPIAITSSYNASHF
jgi:hypothetical protein